jgi:outer membrane protein TolC
MRVRQHVSFCLCSSLLLAATTAAAQSHLDATTGAAPMSRALAEAATAPPLRLEDAVAQAVAANATLAASRSRIEPLRARPAQVQSLPPPMLEAQIWQWPVDTIAPSNADMFMWAVSQELPGRGRRTAAAALARADVRVAEAQVLTGEREIAQAVTAAYWDLALARLAIDIHLKSAELLHQTADAAQAQYAAGRGTQQDALKTIIETTRLHQDVIDLERDARSASVRLNVLRNLSGDEPIGRLDDLEEIALGTTMAEIETFAMKEQPDLRLAALEIDRARAGSDLAHHGRDREWSIGGGYMQRPGGTDAWQARVTVTWPGAPWARKGVDAAIAEAAASISAAEADAAARAARVRLEVDSAYAKADAATARAAVVRTALLPQTRQAIDAARVAYQTGRSDIATLIDAERMALDAELLYTRALVDWRLALADLERAVGTSLPSAMLTRVDEIRRPQ